MKPIEINIWNESSLCSFCVRRDFTANVNCIWHFHKEMELIWFQKGCGLQYVGDSIKEFQAGDVELVGPCVPHFWKYESTTVGNVNNTTPYAVVIHFTPDFFGDEFLNLPENIKLKQALEKLKGGVSVSTHIREQVTTLMSALIEAEGTEKIYLLIKCLLAISDGKELTILSSFGFKFDSLYSYEERITKIYGYVAKNLDQSISVNDVAAMSNLSLPSFCRYFKAKTGKTFSDFLKHVRIGYACKLLTNSRMSVKQIANECGFTAMNTFCKQFRNAKGITPIDYQRRILNYSSPSDV